jgi:mono/diheme cytochrome c family protein
MLTTIPRRPRHRRPARQEILLLGLFLVLASSRVLAQEASSVGKASPAGKDAKAATSEWKAPDEAAKAPNPVPATPESMARGEALYGKACASCHGPLGHGDGKSAKILAKKPADLALFLPVQTDGELFWKLTAGKKPMPSFKKDLKPEQRWDVVNYLRKLTSSAKGDSGASTAPGAAAPAGDGQAKPDPSTQ